MDRGAGGLQFTESQKVRHDQETNPSCLISGLTPTASPLVWASLLTPISIVFFAVK